jgi:hypothetical protein
MPSAPWGLPVPAELMAPRRAVTRPSSAGASRPPHAPWLGQCSADCRSGAATDARPAELARGCGASGIAGVRQCAQPHHPRMMGHRRTRGVCGEGDPDPRCGPRPPRLGCGGDRRPGLPAILVGAVLFLGLCEERVPGRCSRSRLTARTLTGERSVDLNRGRAMCLMRKRPRPTARQCGVVLPSRDPVTHREGAADRRIGQ